MVATDDTSTSNLLPPLAKRVPVERTLHDTTVVDDFAWLKDRDDPDTLAYLRAENDYAASVLAATDELQAKLFEEIKSRVQETDLSVPARKGPWWYYSRTVEGEQYPIHCRRRSEDDDGSERVLVDGNVLAGDSAYFAIGSFAVSPDHAMLAFSTDFDGDENYTLRVKDLERDEVLPDEIPNTYYGAAWSADGSTVFYTTMDDAHRPYRVWRHRVGSPNADDVLVWEDLDERFYAAVLTTRSEAFVVIHSSSKTTSEVLVIPTSDPTAEPAVVATRRDGVEYVVEHHGDRFLIVANDGHEDFALFEAPVDSPGPERWTPLWAPGVGTRVMGVDAFAEHFVVHFRRDGNTGLRVQHVDSGENHEIAFPEPVYTVEPGDNPEFATGLFRLGYDSLVTPHTVYDYDLAARTLVLKKQQPVLGGYDPAAYVTRREWATAADGARVPVSVVEPAGFPHDGSAPLVLYGYGAYEASTDPWFSVGRLSLLERGFAFAIAHIRGGGELGRHWYDEGKLLEKPNTFSDFIACAAHLCAAGYTSPGRLVARGASAGGLLMGAVANQAPDQFRAIVAEVPFVDCVNTMLDPSLPLTITEWEEWGNPADAATYECMESYTPYENVAAREYPAILATAGLHDPRVLYHEPAKWVAKLRAVATGARAPGIVLKTKLEAGHGGASGRYDAWHEEAFVLAFILAATNVR
jgi:oligopeptidase B